MTVLIDPSGAPVEIAPGRGDVRFSSVPTYTVRTGPEAKTLIGGRSVSYAQLYATQPWVAAAVGRMLTWAERVPLKCYRKRGDDGRIELNAPDHPLAKLIKRPWLDSTGGPSNRGRLVQCLLGPMLVHGNSVTEVEEIGGEDWFKPLDWRNIIPVGTTAGTELIGWRYTEGPNQERDLPVSQTLHLAWWSPLGPLGISPLEQLGVTISIEDAAQRYQQSLFANGARPPSAIQASPEFLALEKTDRTTLMEQLRDDVEELYSGPDRGGKPAVLPPGLEWNAIGHSAVEAALIDQRRVAREEVAAVYQIPPPMLGILDHATYSNIDVQREMAYTMALAPPLALIEQNLTSTLARDRYGEDDVYVEFDFGPVLRGDRQKEIQAFRDAIGTGIATMNEARRALNLEPSDEEDADKLFYPANNLKPLGSPPEEKKPSQQIQVPAPGQAPVFPPPPP